ncbi:MAG TPA: ATP-binding protein [Thiobacillaceae bacterium]|nr:ATP-binding protein [Thiobacillaceae bacterium]
MLPRTLFGRNALALLAAFLVSQGLALAVVWKTVVIPLAESSADELAARMVLAAQTWVELPPQTRADFELELSLRHGLELGAVQSRLTQAAPPSPFGRMLGERLSQRSNQAIQLKRGPDPAWTWAELRIGGHLLRMGVLRERYEFRPPLAALAALLLGALLTVLLALFLARQTSRRLRGMAESALTVGQGRLPPRLPETGAQELRQLSAAFNRMAGEVQSLLENRTVLLSGISHDLRTPLTRMRLALSMLEGADPALVARLERDMDEMNRLVGDMLAFARALKVESLQDVDLAALCARLAEQNRALGEIDWQSSPPCPWQANEAALGRIVGNLLGNALRYGEGKAVELALDCGPQQARISVSDRGPGIPAEAREAVFRPFFRLESSRNRDDGGSGLGLAIARQLADAYGWEIRLLDRHGGGLRAELVLPHPAESSSGRSPPLPESDSAPR